MLRLIIFKNIQVSLRGSVPLDVAYSSFMDNNELALALKEEDLEKVTIFLSRCGLAVSENLLHYSNQLEENC